MRKKWGLITVFILCLIPLLWFKRGFLIGGVDFDMPLFPIKQFFLRTFTWNNLLGGSDYSMRLAGLYTFTATQALLKTLGFPLGVVQRIYFVLWYSVSGLAMYYFISSLIKGDNFKARLIRFFAVFFYMLNFYQLHIWMIARKPELSGAIAIPLMLGLLFRSFRGEISKWKLMGFAAIFSWLGSGMGCNPPVLGIFIISIFSLFIITILYLIFKRCSKQLIARNFIIFGIVLSIFILVNLYWILPVANYIIQSGYATDVTKVQDTFALKSLLESTSRHNSFLNVIRMYGDAVWFDGFKGEPYMPFFPSYQNSIVLIILSFMFPILAFSTLLFSKSRYILFFSVLTLIAAFLGKGIHSPFGNIFLWMYKHIPGFWVYRAPWQKFGLFMILGYSFLAAITCGEIYEYFYRRGKKIFSSLFISGIVILTVVYNYAFILGKMIPTTEERKTLPGFYQKYPEYLFRAADWINSLKDEFNVVLLPDDKANAYEWGYGAAYDITWKLFEKGLIFRQYGEGMSPPHSLDKVYQAFISSLYNETTPYTSRILTLLNVRYILHRNDFLYNWAGDTDSPEFVREKISKQKDIILEKSFGKWDFYYNSAVLPHIYTARDIIDVDGKLDYLATLISDEDFNPSAVYLFPDDKNVSGDFISEIITEKISIPESKISILVEDGWKKPINWADMSSAPCYRARFYAGSKKVISCNGKGEQDMLVFNSVKECPYGFALGSPGDHGAYNSTLVYIKTGQKSLKIGSIYADGKPIADVVDIWWETGRAKMNSTSISYPLIIPANQRAIIQINHLIKKEITLTENLEKIYRLGKKTKTDFKEKEQPKVKYRKINPTRFVVNIKAKEPFMLIFNERYHPAWKAYIRESDEKEFVNKKRLYSSALVSIWKNRGKLRELTKHIQVNGFANAWWVDVSEDINASENFEVILEYLPQRLFEMGFIIASLTFIFCLGCLMVSIRKKKKQGVYYNK